MKTKIQMINELNRRDEPKKLGFHLAADDGQNQYWVNGQIRLNRFENESGMIWSDDVSGWEK
jgi:hypothetical protein